MLAKTAASSISLVRQFVVSASLNQTTFGASRLFAAAAGGVNQTALIKQLREKSGAPISDVKKCLEANEWDVEKAYEALRKRGLAAAAKKASRHASEGLIGLHVISPESAAVVEINSETDFVARNELFQNLVRRVAAAAGPLTPKAAETNELDVDKLMAAPVEGGPSVSAACADVAAQVRENIKLRRGFRIQSAPGGHLSTYIHQSSGPGLGRIVSAVVLQPADGTPLPEAAKPKVAELAHQLAMHAAGMKPQFLDRASVPSAALDKERAILKEQAAASGKPEAVINKMVEGRLGKFYEDMCLLEQRFFLDDSVKVSGAVNRLSKEIGVKLALANFLRVQCGEGVEAAAKQDFASEVAAAVKGV